MSDSIINYVYILVKLLNKAGYDCNQIALETTMSSGKIFEIARKSAPSISLSTLRKIERFAMEVAEADDESGN